MSVMEKLFGSSNQPAAATGAPGLPAFPGGHQPMVAPPAQAPVATHIGPGTPPAATPAPTAAPVPGTGSSLDNFKDFWQTPTTADGKPVAQPPNPAQPIFNFDPTKVSTAAKGLDFTKDVNPETLAKVVAGGQEAVPALLELLNSVQQNAYTAMMLQTGSLFNQGIAKHSETLMTTLPTQIRQQQLQQLPTANPVLNHPTAQPLVNALRTIAFNNNPNASPADIAAKVDAMLTNFATELSASTQGVPQQQAAAAAAEPDWMTWMK